MSIIDFVYNLPLLDYFEIKLLAQFIGDFVNNKHLLKRDLMSLLEFRFGLIFMSYVAINIKCDLN